MALGVPHGTCDPVARGPAGSHAGALQLTDAEAPEEKGSACPNPSAPETEMRPGLDGSGGL